MPEPAEASFPGKVIAKPYPWVRADMLLIYHRRGPQERSSGVGRRGSAM